MSTENDNAAKPRKKKGRPKAQPAIPLELPLPQEPPVVRPEPPVMSPETHGTPERPAKDDLIQTFVTAHRAFEGAFCKMLHYAKEAGEALLKLQGQTGLKGTTLFDHVRAQAEVQVSDRSLFLYQRIASRWNELQVVAGDRLNELTLSKASKLLQEPRSGPATASPRPEGQAHDSPIGLFKPGAAGLCDARADESVPAEDPPSVVGGRSPAVSIGAGQGQTLAGSEPADQPSQGVQQGASPKADLLTVLAQVVFQLEYLSQEADPVEDAPSILQLADRAIELIQCIRAKVA